MPCTPRASIVLRSAWIPAPPPESEPAIVSTRGGVTMVISLMPPAGRRDVCSPRGGRPAVDHAWESGDQATRQRAPVRLQAEGALNRPWPVNTRRTVWPGAIILVLRKVARVAADLSRTAPE